MGFFVMNISKIDNETLRGKARDLDNIFNVYVVGYLTLAVCYGVNEFFRFIHNQYFFTSILVVLWLIMKPTILFFVIQIKNILRQKWLILALVTLFLPFGELLSANVVIRNVVELLTKDENN